MVLPCRLCHKDIILKKGKPQMRLITSKLRRLEPEVNMLKAMKILYEYEGPADGYVCNVCYFCAEKEMRTLLAARPGAGDLRFGDHIYASIHSLPPKDQPPAPTVKPTAAPTAKPAASKPTAKPTASKPTAKPTASKPTAKPTASKPTCNRERRVLVPPSKFASFVTPAEEARLRKESRISSATISITPTVSRQNEQTPCQEKHEKQEKRVKKEEAMDGVAKSMRLSHYYAAFRHILSTGSTAKRAFRKLVRKTVKTETKKYLKDNKYPRLSSTSNVTDFDWSEVNLDATERMATLTEALLGAFPQKIFPEKSSMMITRMAFMISIALYSHNPRRFNIIQALNGIRLQNCGVPEELLRYMNRLGVCSSSKSIKSHIKKFFSESDTGNKKDLESNGQREDPETSAAVQSILNSDPHSDAQNSVDSDAQNIDHSDSQNMVHSDSQNIVHSDVQNAVHSDAHSNDHDNASVSWNEFPLLPPVPESTPDNIFASPSPRNSVSAYNEDEMEHVGDEDEEEGEEMEQEEADEEVMEDEDEELGEEEDDNLFEEDEDEEEI